MHPTPFTPNEPSFDNLIAEATSQGHGFVARFATRWQSGDFLFDKPGEKLLALRDNQKIIAFSGICIDPYSDDPTAGRIRHLYVLNDWRNQGLGRVLVETLIQPPHPFCAIRLRADDIAAKFYERLGWVKTDAPNATHEHMNETI